MKIKNFIIPDAILNLSAKSIWPRDRIAASNQNLKPLVSSDIIKELAFDEDSIYLNALESFSILSDEFAENYEFWSMEGALDEIKAEFCVIIGDFGLGSDAPIVLDYSDDKINPCIKRLVWNKNGNYWEKIASDIDEFLMKLQIGKNVT